MAENFARRRLQRLGDEVRDWGRSSLSTELRYVALIPIGERYRLLSSLRSWEMPPSNWEFIPRRRRSSTPIEVGSFRRSADRKEIDFCFYGNVNRAEWDRFKDWTVEATNAATSALERYKATLGPIRRDHNGWMHICFRIAWEYPEKIDYVIESDVHIEPPFPSEWLIESRDGTNYYQPRNREFDPFLSWPEFDAYERGKASLQEGRHFAFLSRDLRICSSNAIDAILAIGESPEKPVWDKGNKEIKFGDVICRKYARFSNLQFPVFDRFENEGWPESIYSPFPDPDKSKEVIKDINRGLDSDSPIRFGVENNRLVWSKVEKKL